MTSDDRFERPHWSLADLELGARFALPVLPGMVTFGMAVGATAAGKGLTLLHSVLMNALVFAGASQLVALEVWPQQFTWGAILGLAVVVATVNARILLITAALQPHFARLPAWQAYPLLYLTTDPAFLITLRAEGGKASLASVFLGASLVFLATWMAASTAGFLLGASFGDPRRFGLDLVMPIFFATFLIPLWRGARAAVPWIVAGAVALIVQQLVPGAYFVVAGAVAGSVLGGFLDDAE